MVGIIEGKIAELEKEKSELDLSFLQLQKKEYEQRISELLANPICEGEGGTAITRFNEVRECHENIKEIDRKIQHKSELEEKINKKIALYQRGKEKIDNTPLYRDTKEGIAEIFGRNVIDYIEQTNDEELMNKLRTRTLTFQEYFSEKYIKDLKLFSLELSEFLDLEYNASLIKEHNEKEEMYNELIKRYFRKEKKKGESQPAPKNVILLPEGMSQQIREELKDKDIHPEDMESFLKKELKKNAGEIMLSHIKNKFKDKYKQAYEYIRRLIINYPGFRIIDNVEKKDISQSQSKHEKLISSVSAQESEESKNERLRKKNLLSKLKEIGDDENLKSRISKYTDLFEETDCKFSDKEIFEEELYEAISFYTHIQIEKEIQKILTSIIQDNLRLERTGLFGYYAYKLSRGCDNRRIVAYPNGEIFTICSHEDYEKLINTQPPVEKSK